jgi:hypothetical protein
MLVDLLAVIGQARLGTEDSRLTRSCLQRNAFEAVWDAAHSLGDNHD